MKYRFREFGVFLFLSATVHGHGFGRLGDQMGEQTVDWRTDQISRAVALSNGQVVSLDGKKCLEGSSFFFNVEES